MDNPPPVRKKWSERQFELFVDAARELGPETSKEEFERLLDRILPPQEQKRKRRRPGSGDGPHEDEA
ncbi:MAG TPA: hypothetical protein VLQ65_06405 [Saliniramus sp.]|nr:hypothetical protein [Saliniramus sp.]